jgi:hypothetical protein
MYRRYGDWIDGVRPSHIIETELDIVRYAMEMRVSPRGERPGRYDDGRKIERGGIVCGFCGAEGRMRNEREGREWFFSGHRCVAEGETIWQASDGTIYHQEAA